jgi:hypothetical protein
MRTELNLMRSIYGEESAAPRGAWLVGYSAFPGLRAALRRFTPGYCSSGASRA